MAKKTKIRIGIMIGSDSDLKQCREGLKLLEREEKAGRIRVVKVITNSIHRNTDEALENLRRFKVDVWIIGAGWANQLTGTADAYLRYNMRDDRVPVLGVAFEGTPEQTKAAVMSIRYVPGTQVIFFDSFVGSAGFTQACRMAVAGDFPKIKLPDLKPVKIRTLKEAIEAANKI